MPLGSVINDVRNELRNGNTIMQLIIVNTVVFLVVNLFAVILKGFGYQAIGEIPELYLSMPLAFFEFIKKPWTLVSYMFMHAGPLHIIFNMLWFYWFAKIFELYLGDKKIWAVYFWGGLVGGILALLLVNIMPGFRDNAGLMVGASGAVLAVVFAAATINPDHMVNLLFIGEVRIKYIAVVSLLIDLVSMRYGNTGGYICHLGGAIMGYTYITLLRNGTELPSPTTAIANLFKRKPQVRLSHKSETKLSHKKAPTDDIQERLDAILDKISRSGYDSLTKEERDFLFQYSNKQ